MTRTIALACLVVTFATGLAVAQDKDEAPSWRGDIESTGVKAFPHATKKDTLMLGAFRTADEWRAFWKAKGEDAPKVDFEKYVVVYAVNQVWPGTCELAKPTLNDGTATFVVDAGKRVERKAYRCHYEYGLRAIARKDVKAIEFKQKGHEKEDALCRVDPVRPDDKRGLE